jgi:Na+-transporting NADH:ubiquinone oxidoreductase subunit C
VRQSNLYTIVFIIITSFAAALILSVSSSVLKERQERNAELDVKKNILYAVDLLKDSSDPEKLYKEYIRSTVVNSQGKVLEKSAPAEKINFERELEKKPAEREYPVFMSINEKDGKISAYCIPIVGKGLWSTLYGYLALETDLKTIKGISFYKHAETPGLGGEIEKPEFQKNFYGKKILSESGELVSVTVLKGKTRPNSPSLIHEVDGISGATLTVNGVNKLLKDCLLIYEPYFKTIRSETARKGE